MKRTLPLPLSAGFAAALVLVSANGCDSAQPAQPSHAGSGGAEAGQGGQATPAEAGSDSGSSASSGGWGGASSIEGGAAGVGSGGSAAEAGAGGEAAHVPQLLELSGSITHVHDPDIIEDAGTYYLFSTGEGIPVRRSTDLSSWHDAGSVFASKPSWITTTDPSNPNQLWAPEVRRFGGVFHLYYSASKFGSKQSCIGHATRSSLGSGAWQDDGQALLCTNLGGQTMDYNAIDPDPFEDAEGNFWLAFGSFWSGLKLVRLDDAGRRDGADLFSLSTRPNTAVEAAHLHYHGGYYYLFESVDACCQGSASTYKIMVGRSLDVIGPYVDRNGVALLDGGGTLLLQGAQRWRGPGHNAILSDGQRTLNVYHAYDSENDGVPTLRIAEIGWTTDGWPESAGP